MLQTVLTKLGFLDDKIDGIYGRKTKTAVLAFQVMYGVCTPIQSGFGYYCGPRTRSRLNDLINN
jgi:peptidoglycan hydrolase-like protein with peptidoglycan-binding domain